VPEVVKRSLCRLWYNFQKRRHLSALNLGAKKP
jgi:hypothetical protein